MRSRPSLARLAGVIVLLVCAPRAGWAQLNDQCTVSVLNRSVRVNADGSWVLPNIPANFGPVRARITCLVNGETVSGESDLFTVPANGVVNLPPTFRFGQTTPIPTSLTLTATVDTLTQVGATTALTVTARYADGTAKDVTGVDTQFTISNPAIATIGADAVVRAVTSGTVVIQATHEGAAGMVSIQVALAGVDSDGDGIPDDYELAHGMNPNNAVDAAEDFDRDGLTNLEEYRLGTDPRQPDTDGDGLSDGREVALGTNPLLKDTDGDGISDGLEIESGSDPLDPTSYNLSAALSGISITPSVFTLTFNTIAGDVSVALKVTGTLKDNTTLDLTARQGTAFSSSDLNVCSFGATKGRVFAGVSGSCVITISAGGFTATATGAVHTFAPIPLSYLELGGSGLSVDVSGEFAYVAVNGVGLKVVDVTNRSAPRVVATLNLPGSANDVKVAGNRAYFAAGEAGLHVIDISNPLVPRLLGSVDTPGSANDVRVRGDLAFVADGSSGLQIVDVSNPGVPRVVGTFATAGAANGVDVAGTLAVIAADAFVQIADVSDPSQPRTLGTVASAGTANDVVVRGSTAYIANGTGSLRAVDFTIPTAPRLAGTVPTSLGGILGDIAIADTFLFGADIFFVNGVPIVDGTDPDNLLPRAILDFRQFRDDDGAGIAVDGSYVYLGTYQGRLYIGQYRIREDLNGVPPTVGIASPSAGETFVEGETIPVTVAASDDLAVARVTLAGNGATIGTATAVPYLFNARAPIGVKTFTLSASAADLGNNIGIAPEVELAVIPDPLTTVAGRVIKTDGNPIAGAAITCGGQSALTPPDGSFTISSVPTVSPVLICTASASPQGATLAGRSSSVLAVRGGTTQVGDVVIGAVPTLAAISRKSAFFNTTISRLVVVGTGFQDAVFSFGTPAVTVTAAVVSADGTTATLSVSVGARPATLALVATNAYGNSGTATTPINRFSVVDPGSESDSDGDGVPDVIECALGSDPADASSVPATNPPASGEVDGRTLNVLNTAGASSDEALGREADAPSFSALNIAEFTGGQPLRLRFESDATVLSILNAVPNPAGTPAEVNAVPVTTLNTVALNGGQPLANESDAPSFSVLNANQNVGLSAVGGAAAPVNLLFVWPWTQMEADATVSVANIAASPQPRSASLASHSLVGISVLPNVSRRGGLETSDSTIARRQR